MATDKLPIHGGTEAPLIVAFVALYAYPLFKPAAETPFGGSEVRATTLARCLSRRSDIQVHFIVADHGGGSEVMDGITLHHHPDYPTSLRLHWFVRWLRDGPPRRGISWAWRRIPARAWLRRLLLARPVAANSSGPAQRLEWTAGTASILSHIGPGVVATFGVNDVSAEIVAWCKAMGRPSVLCVGSDSDLADHFLERSTAVDPWGRISRLGFEAIKRADAICVQTLWQKDRLSAAFGRDSVVIPNPIDLDTKTSSEDPEKDIDVLWIGKSDQCKRPHLLIELARSLPQFRFHMVMTRSDHVYHENILTTLPTNISIEEYVPFSNIDYLFRRARLLANTSSLEGFPNTFLQAGKWGVPIVSLVVDPDGFIERTGSGAVGGGDMVSVGVAVRKLLGDPFLWNAASTAIRAYVETYHDGIDAAESLEAVLRRNAVKVQ